MREKKKNTCSRIRILGNGMMTAGFLLGTAAVGLWAEGNETGIWVGAAGTLVFWAGFLEKLLWWRCPWCRAHLMLCIRGKQEKCPCCSRLLR